MEFERELGGGGVREIKFRVWAIASRVMFYPDSEDGWVIKNGILSPLPNTILMQLTGLKDKNGKEVYEGDIIKDVAVKDDLGREYKIAFDDGCFDAESYNGSCCLQDIYLSDMEVIGNIHENPELLEEL